MRICKHVLDVITQE